MIGLSWKRFIGQKKSDYGNRVGFFRKKSFPESPVAGEPGTCLYFVWQDSVQEKRLYGLWRRYPDCLIAKLGKDKNW
jgi:hypothetical protein